MAKLEYHYLGCARFKRKDGGGSVCLIYLAASQPSGDYRPVSTRTSLGDRVGTFVEEEVYNEVAAQNLKPWDKVTPEWGENSALYSVRKG